MSKIVLDEEAHHAALKAAGRYCPDGVPDPMRRADLVTTAIRAYLVAEANKGVVRVPNEPTEAMVQEGRYAQNFSATTIFRAMCAASPYAKEGKP